MEGECEKHPPTLPVNGEGEVLPPVDGGIEGGKDHACEQRTDKPAHNPYERVR